MKSFTKSYQPIINTHTRTYAHGEERSPVAAAATAESHDGWEGKKKLRSIRSEEFPALPKNTNFKGTSVCPFFDCFLFLTSNL